MTTPSTDADSAPRGTRPPLPPCKHCGATPSSRSELDCTSCGAVLEWKVWDQAAIRIMRFDSADEERCVETLARIEADPQFKERKRALIARRERPFPMKVERWDGKGEVVAMLYTGFVTVAAMRNEGGWFVALVMAWCALSAAFEEWRFRRAQKRWLELMLKEVRPVVVLSVSAPRRIGPGIESPLREVLFYVQGSGVWNLTALEPIGSRLRTGQAGLMICRDDSLDDYEQLGTVEGLEEPVFDR